MAINNLRDKFIHELGDIYDAEHQFLKGQDEMLRHATDGKLVEQSTPQLLQKAAQAEGLQMQPGAFDQLYSSQ